MTFAEKVKIARAKLFISQKELAREIGVSLVTVARWETQGREPQFISAKKFEAFCKKKGIDFKDDEGTV